MNRLVLLLVVLALFTACSPAAAGVTPAPTEVPTPVQAATAPTAVVPAPTATPAATPTVTPTVSTAPAATASPVPEDGKISRQEALDALLDEQPPDFTLVDIDGKEHTLSDYKGKIVFVSFFATWCPPCVEEMPYFQRLVEANDDLVVLAVQSALVELRKPSASEADAGRAAELARGYAKENGFTFPILLDADGSVADNPFYATQGIPGNFVIDREGTLRYFQEGAYSEEFLDIVLEYLRALDEPA